MTEIVEKVRTLSGRVVSKKMNKTATVLVERLVKHPVYGKYVKRSTKFLVHDESNISREGDVVSITSCRPISKNKTFRLVDVLVSSVK